LNARRWSRFLNDGVRDLDVVKIDLQWADPHRMKKLLFLVRAAAFQDDKLSVQRHCVKSSTIDKMALISAFTIIRAISLFHLTAAYFFLTNPRILTDQNIVFILGESIRVVCIVSIFSGGTTKWKLATRHISGQAKRVVCIHCSLACLHRYSRSHRCIAPRRGCSGVLAFECPCATALPFRFEWLCVSIQRRWSARKPFNA
jgi:hypothetical protein